MFPSYHTILDKYFTQCEGRHIIFHQIESFNTFMDIDIPEIIKNSNPIIVRGSPEVPLSGPRSALASATGLSTSAANALMGIAGAAGAGAGAGAGVTINEFMGPKYEYEVNMTFENLTFRKPTIFENNGAIQPMMPNDARLRNLTYASPLFVDVRVKTTFIDNTSKGERTERERLFPNVHMGKIPIMVGSKYCLLHDQTYVHPKVLGECAEDFGGYFIVSGGERVIISQERMSENRPFVFRNNKANNKDIEIIEVKSIGPDNDQVPKSNSVKIVYHPKNSQIHLLKANLPRIKSDIPLFILFRALGITNDRDIIHLILGEQEEYFSLFDESIQEASFIHNQEEAFIYIANEMNSSASKHAKHNTMKIQDLLHNELFPHVGLKDEDNYAKACFLAHMTRKLLWVSSSKIPNDDRDAYPNKRVDLPGFLLASLFRTYFNNKMVKDIRSGVSKEIHNGSWRASGNFEDIVNMSNINKIIKSVIMEIGLKTSLATGNFGSAKIGGPTKIGVSQVLNRLNYLAGVSHLRRVSTPIEKTGKLIAPRKLHNTGFGYICVTSDTHIIHGDGISTSKIIDMKDGDTVLTADSTTLIESSSEIYNYFKTTPTKVLKIKTLSGRTIGCSADHPLLVEKDGGFEWIHAGDLTIHDNLVVKNYTIPLSKDGTLLNIPFSKLTTTDTCSKRQNELKQLGFIDNDIDHTKMEILARLYGACVTDGHIATGKYGWTVSFYIGEESDAIAILEDIERLGFAKPRYGKKSSTYTNPETKKEVHYNYYVVNKGGAFATLLITLGCIVGKKGTCKNPIVPTWILNASQSVKREFLSGFQGGDGCRITMYSNGDGKNKVGINATQQTCSTEYADTHYSYIKSISELFTNLGIQSSVEQIHKEKNTIHLLKIKNNYENMGVYVKTIGYRYCAEKTRASALPIEYILYRNDLLTLKKENIYKIHELRAQGKTMDFIYQQMKSSMSLESVREFSNDLTKKCVPKCANSLSYNEFCKTTKQIDTRIIIGISEISEIAIETVYDFTTRSDNHDFYANGILVRNCPSETPEGHSVGVVKNLSSTASVSIYSNVNILKDYIKAHKMCIPLADSTIEQKYGLVRLFINGAWIGSIPHENVMACVRNLKKAKQAGKIHAFTGIIWKPQFKELWMTTEAGRLLRPLYCAETIREIAADSSGKLLQEVHDVKTWNELLLWCSPKGNQLIEYIDPGETECSYIAMKFEELEEDHTHMEIHPSTALGTLASNIPFPDHNQSPRNSYQCAMGKQAMGMYAMNFKDRFDTMAHVLCYPQVPFVSSYMSKFYGAQSMPCGQNVTVAIMTYTGYNQEDSVMLNRAALDRGLFRSIFYRTYKDEERKNQSSGEEEKFCRPDPDTTKQLKHANYSKLDEDGFVPENTYVDADDILIGKVVPIRVPTGSVIPVGAKKLRDVSRTIRNNETGWVDKIFKNRNGEGYSFVKVRVRQDRIPEIGDKFCLTADHDVLTETRGWIPIHEVTLDDSIAQLNKETGSMEYVKPLETLEFDHDGDMYEVESQGVSLKTTMNHRMWVRVKDTYNLVLAKDILDKNVYYQGTHSETFVKSGEGNIVQYSGKVYCLRVPTEVFLVRRHGRIVWTGNSSRHGQKGTLGMILNSEDMPQTASGIIPDIIINPHCFTEDHEILTSQGFKNMEEVNELYNSGKLIIGGYNHVEGVLVYEAASAVIIKDAPDTMIEFTQNESNVSLIVTPDHDMFATRDETLTWKDYKKEKAHTFLKQDGIIKFLSMPDNGSIVTTSFPEVVLQSTRDIKEITTYKGKVWCVSVPHGFVVARRATRDEDGIVTKASRPIIVGNCIPSRMTIAQFMETLLGKVSCEMGTLGDGSPFNDVTIEGLSSMLRDKMGLEPYGNEIMYNGFTGRMMETSIFTGPVYYQRLRHCSADKIHSRSSGPLVMLTRQPAEGRAREGGLRFGEMERDAVISHGISEFTKERFMECSDLFRCFTCRDCGLIAISNPKEGVWCCRGCGNSTSFSAIEIPYAYKLLLQELETMNITSRIITQSKLLKMEAHNVEDKKV